MSRPAGTPAEGPRARLPFIDEYTIEIGAPPERVWDALVHEALPRFGAGAGPLGPLGARLLGCPYTERPGPGPHVPEAIVGFRVDRAERPALVALGGHHRFSRYSLTFTIEPAGAGSRLRATTHAAFPGPAGPWYRRLVIGTGAHVLLLRRLLSQIKRSVELRASRGS